MAIAAADLIAPAGPVTVDVLTALGPATLGDDFDDTASDATTAAAVAAAYVAVGTARTADWTDATRQDAGALAWAASRAFGDRAQQILTGMLSATAEGDGSRSYAVAQATALQKLAAEQRALFDAEEATEAAGDALVPSPRASRTVTNTFVW